MNVGDITPTLLLARLDAIGAALARRDDALALLALGSVGRETERLDRFSDLDFFAIVATGAKRRYLDDLSWLADAHPLVFNFANTPDGHKALFADGVFCEFAVFEPHELAAIPYAPGRIVWKRPDVDEAIAVPKRVLPARDDRSEEWQVGEALTNLFAGLARHARGEKLAAFRLIQVFAVDRVLELAQRIENQEELRQRQGQRDPFALERRAEVRLSQLARQLPALMRGYAANAESALEILAWLERRFRVNAALAAAIRQLAALAAR